MFKQTWESVKKGAIVNECGFASPAFRITRSDGVDDPKVAELLPMQVEFLEPALG